MRMFVNVFGSPSLAMQAAAKLKAKADVQAAMTAGQSAVLSQGRIVFVAGSSGYPLDIDRVEHIVQKAGEVPLPGALPQHEASRQIASPPTQHVEAQTDVLDQLRKLGELRDNGVVSAEEFEAKKAELLKRL
jgi:hypothetical protein